jgi:predicted O-methyltransferase YrrM
MTSILSSIANFLLPARMRALEDALQRTPARHCEPSVILSADDEIARPTPRLMDLALGAVNRARFIDLIELDGRTSSEARWYRTWPGEHYRLLAALVQELNAKTVIEIGTFTGMGTLSLAQTLPAGGRVVTFDLQAWRDFEQTWLIESDFADGRITQILADIGTPGGIRPYQDIFADADFIFVDGPKDGVTEQKFIDAIGSLVLPKNPIVMFDDTRVINMIEIWRRFSRSKMDITSFGHWSGTGLVDWNGVSPERER